MATNDLPTNLELIDQYTKDLENAVVGAQATTEAHERFIKGTVSETIDTDQGPIKSLSGQIAEWRADADQAVSDQIQIYDNDFTNRLDQYDSDFDAYLLTIGFQTPVEYEAGIEITERSQTVSFGGRIYFWSGTLPFTTSGTFANDTDFEFAPILGGVEKPRFSFAEGGVLYSISNSVQGIDGQWYYWDGAYPKIIASNSTVESSGGLGDGAFKLASGYINARPSLELQVAGTGHTLNERNFQIGTTLVSNRELLLDANTGKLYKWMGDIPKVVDAASTPVSTGGISDTAWVDFSQHIKMFKFIETIRSMGYSVAGNFLEGGLLTEASQLVVDLDTKCYQWGGSLPKTIEAGEDPTQDSTWQIFNLSVSGGGSGSLTVISEQAPIIPANGMSWYIPSECSTFIYYIDPNGTGQWVEEDSVGDDGGSSFNFTQEEAPTGNLFKGARWFKPSTSQEFIYYVGPNEVGVWTEANDTGDSASLQGLDGLNEPSVLDLNYERVVSLANIPSLKIGSRVNILERNNAKFLVSPLGVMANGYNTIGFDNFVLELDEPFTLARLGVQTGVDISTDLNNIIGIMIARGETVGSRVKVEPLGFDAGTYLINNTVNILNIRDFNFYAVDGGKGTVTLDFSGATNSDGITATHAAFGKFSGLTFKDVVDGNNNIFSIGSSTNLIRGWDFVDCDYIACKRCFRVDGDFLCSEFSFTRCDFLQCHTLKYNLNIQAVNWNFFSCNWENDSLVFAGDNSESCVFQCEAGTFVTWNGGSIIPQGRLSLAIFRAAAMSFRNTNAIILNNTRIEIHPTSGVNNPPLVDRTLDGYVTATNSMPVIFNDCSILTRGGVQANYNLANVWNRSSLTLRNTPCSPCTITGVYDGATGTAQGELNIESNIGVTYIDDPTNAKASKYINHAVKITQDNSVNVEGFDVETSDATTLQSEREKIVRVRSATGRIPLAGTETILPSLPDNATILSIGYRRLQVANTGQSFTATLKSSDGVTTYGTVTMATNERNVNTDILLDTPTDITNDLKVEFSGTPEQCFGYFEVRYI